MAKPVHVNRHARNLKRKPNVTHAGPATSAILIREGPGVQMAYERVWKVRFPDGTVGTMTRVDSDPETGEETFYMDFEDANDFTGSAEELVKEYPELEPLMWNLGHTGLEIKSAKDVKARRFTSPFGTGGNNWSITSPSGEEFILHSFPKRDGPGYVLERPNSNEAIAKFRTKKEAMDYIATKS